MAQRNDWQRTREVKVVCASCGQTIDSLGLIVDANAPKDSIFGICDDCKKTRPHEETCESCEGTGWVHRDGERCVCEVCGKGDGS